MKEEGKLYRLGIVGGSPELRRSCRSALRNVAHIVELNLIPDTGEPTEDIEIELLLYRLYPPLEATVLLMAKFRSMNPGIPIIALGSDVPNDLAVELIKCGIDDYLSVPIEHFGLHRKVLRALGEHEGPSFSWTMLNAFRRGEIERQGRNRRHCFRVPVEPMASVTVLIPTDQLALRLPVSNISIATDGWPGGLLVSADLESQSLLPFDSWEQGKELTLFLELPTEEAPIELLGQLVSTIRHGPCGSIDFALQYWTMRSADDGTIRKYWADAQRPNRVSPPPRPAKPSRPSSPPRSFRR